MPIAETIKGSNMKVPVKIWTKDIQDAALDQLLDLATLPFLHKHVAVMPDVHAGIGSTVGTVIATDRVLIPAAVGVDIGCGMNAVRLSLTASDLPDSLREIRHSIERGVPLGAGGAHTTSAKLDRHADLVCDLDPSGSTFRMIGEATHRGDYDRAMNKMASQLGTLGSGNHFIELCIDEAQNVWVMLHSGSRGIGNSIGRHFIEKAKREMEKWHIHLPNDDLAYLPEGSTEFDEYRAAVFWAQGYAFANRAVMMDEVIRNLRHHIQKPFDITHEAINCHHNYVEMENHFGKNIWVTRKGAIRAREGDLGIIPGSMGAKSYIVRGKGNAESFHSCSHGAGRIMSRTQAAKNFTVEDLKAQTEGVECRKDSSVLDEIPGCYKDIDGVMANQIDLVEVVHTLKQVLCVKGA